MRARRAGFRLQWLLTVAMAPAAGVAQHLPESLPDIRWHLTARPWQSLAVPRDAYLDVIEGICRFTIRHQDRHGAVIDAFLEREHQYSTPYFAFAVGVLAHAGRAPDLLPHGVRAMDHATASFAGGAPAIPDQHGEFFVPSLAGALELYRGHVPEAQWNVWETRLQTPLEKVWEGADQHLNNWRTYAMKGEWMRAKLGLVDRVRAAGFVARQWEAGQRDRIAGDRWNLYQDHSSDPESHAVEAVGRGNLIALAAEGYDGRYAGEIRRTVERGTRVSLLLQDPTGQCPMNGRTDDHVFNDVLYQLAFEVMAERAAAAGDRVLAGRYRRAAMLSFRSFQRWRREDPPWTGSFFITKNKFDPGLRIGYQPASNYGNYNGAVMIHLGEAWLSRTSEIAEQPAPAEIGGYALAMDPGFSSVFANAGGMQMAANLRGEVNGKYGVYWTPLGVVRFGRPRWETRLGPSDGVRDQHSKRGVTFAPTWEAGGNWIRLADVPQDYDGTFHPELAHPLLVRCRIDYRPRRPDAGPSFRHDFVLTPDGVLASLRAEGAAKFGVTLPLLEDDGTPLRITVSDHGAAVRYPGGADEQNFVVLGPEPSLDSSEPAVRSPYGWLRPVRATAPGGAVDVFVYPRDGTDPAADRVRRSFRRTGSGFSSVLGRVEGNLYVGRTSAGGVGSRIDVDGDGRDDASFSEECGFLLQLDGGRIQAVETDRSVSAELAGKKIRLSAFNPVRLR